MTDLNKASQEAVDAARQGDRYAEMLAVVAAQAAQAQQVPQVVHVHQAAPDRVLQRVALGAGGGAVAAGVVYGPLIVAAFASIAITLLVLALAVAVLTWGIVTVVRAVGGAGPKTRRR